jgi:hypothetical protein
MNQALSALGRYHTQPPRSDPPPGGSSPPLQVLRYMKLPVMSVMKAAVVQAKLSLGPSASKGFASPISA